MPYVDLLSKEDYSSVYYFTNTPTGTVGGFDPAKPTIVMMHPLHMDSTWLYPQLDDPRLREKYNIIGFDTRVTGKSVYRFNGKYDLWVAAADLAHAIHYLGLPPSHFFASEVFSFAVCRFAALFPELCLSMTLCNVPAQTEMKAVFDTYDELCQLWGYAEDLETFEHANKLLLSYVASPTSHMDTQDDIIAYWQTEYPPWKRSHIIAFAQVCLNRTAMTPTELAAIKVPTLIIQADKNPMYPMENAEALQRALAGVPGGAAIFSVKAEIGFLTVFSASIVNQTFAKFLARQPRTHSDLRRKVASCEGLMRTGLERLAAFKVDSSFLTRDLKSPLSFSCVTEEIRVSQEGAVAAFAKRTEACLVTAGYGRKTATESFRKEGIIGSTMGRTDTLILRVEKKGKEDKKRFKTKAQQKQQPATSPPNSPPRNLVPLLPPVEFIDTEPVSLSQQQLARSRRMMMVDPTVNSAEQQIVKGTMAKVMAHHTTPLPLSRLLR